MNFMKKTRKPGRSVFLENEETSDQGQGNLDPGKKNRFGSWVANKLRSQAELNEP